MAGFKEGVRVSTDDSIKGLAKAFGTGGEFGNLIDDLSKTLFGTISNLKDAFFIFQVEVAKGFFGALKDNLGDLKKTVETNKRTIADFGNTIGRGLSTAINGTVIATFKTLIALKLILFFKNLATSIGLASIAMLKFNKAVKKNLLIGAAAATIANLDIIIKKFKELFNIGDMDIESQLQEGFKIIEVIDAFGNKVTRVVKDLEHPMHNIFVETLPPIKEAETTLDKIKRHIRETAERLGQLNEDALNKTQEKFRNIKETVAKGLNDGISKMSNALARSIVLGENLAESFKKMAQQLAVRVLSAIIEIIARKTVELAIEKLITREKEKQRNLSAASGNPLAILSFFTGFSQGGAVSKNKPILVGEKGPELFVPNQTGQITQNARGTSGSPVNVNFNINTVDASGFEDLLVRSRGTITQLINNAVNERGRAALI